MRSIVVVRHGGPEVLELRDVPAPQPGANEALVKVHFAGMNYADLMQRRGLYPGGPEPPFGAGFEIAGVIENVGADVAQWKPGDAVMGMCAAGYSEYAVADANQLLAKPAGLDFKEAAAIPCQYLTAYHALLTLGGLRPGQTVLIQAAAGGLGTFLVQIATAVGATVIGTCSTKDKCDLLRSIGCAHPVNYAEQDFGVEVKRLTEGRGCDLVIESVGGDVFVKSLECVRPRGRLVTLGFASGRPRSVQAQYLLVNSITVSGFHLSAYASDTEAMMKAVRDLDGWLASGALRVVVGHTFPLEQAAEAQRLIGERKTSGKVVLAVSGYSRQRTR